ncbi:YajG family lipoprotein [Vibrio zhugei]|uniref:YajG family lipoprotein n=1 Tax=Vibrio zhugei TaxID=2479546 RepID=A0ABV7C2R8_9VIBR|nr:YajG family lipoprotein [Vibrio zhugei]
MRKLVLAASIALLSACSTPQQQVNFVPKPTTSQSPVTQNASFTLTSKDVRSAQYIALVDSGRNQIEPIHARQNVRIAIENAVKDQFQSQGFNVTVNSKNSVNVEIENALVKVKHSILDNEMTAKVVIEVTAQSPTGRLVKTFTGTANRTAALSASVQDVQMVFNDVVNNVLKEMANDTELRQYMKERFHG